jgi:hypothetical protein
MIVCDLCGQAKECSQKAIEGKEYDICFDCWNALAEKTQGEGQGEQRAGDSIPAAAEEGTGSARIEALTRRAANDLG